MRLGVSVSSGKPRDIVTWYWKGAGERGGNKGKGGEVQWNS